MLQKLELNWIGKNEEIKIEPRILIEVAELSNTKNNKETENMIIHGDNLLALKALEKDYIGKIKCVYIDPPYNTGSAFEHYDDNLEHSIWLSLMKPRLEILRNLLRDDGVIFVQIDDNEQAYLKVLMDEVFGRKNFLNMVSVNIKNIAGASGGGEDKKLKKNCEYILIYTKNYDVMSIFKGTYKYTEIYDLIQQYKNEEKSWKYTSVLMDEGEKEYHGSTLDGDGNEIKVYVRKNVIIKSINQVIESDDISLREGYNRYGMKIFRTTNAQSSIRTRVMEYKKENNIENSIISIEYVPKTGKNKGILYEQFYKDEKCNLFVWLRDTSEIIDEKLYKKDILGTYWDINAFMKNISKEGDVKFPQGKKPEMLIQKIFELSTSEGDFVLDSFLGSGTTCAVAQKMNRKYIGIEMGAHAYTHCKVRMDKVIDGEQGGISKAINWSGGGSYKFYELAPTLVKKDFLDIEIINPEYNPEMLATTVALHEGYTYNPSEDVFWKQSIGTENSFLFVTTNYIDMNYVTKIREMMEENEFLLIACKAFEEKANTLFDNIKIKKIPEMILENCEFGRDNYNLNIISPIEYEEDYYEEE